MFTFKTVSFFKLKKSKSGKRPWRHRRWTKKKREKSNLCLCNMQLYMRVCIVHTFQTLETVSIVAYLLYCILVCSLFTISCKHGGYRQMELFSFFSFNPPSKPWIGIEEGLKEKKEMLSKKEEIFFKYICMCFFVSTWMCAHLFLFSCSKRRRCRKRERKR